MKLHASFVGGTGAGKTYSVRCILQELRSLFADGAVFWVATRSSWLSNADLLKVMPSLLRCVLHLMIIEMGIFAAAGHDCAKLCVCQRRVDCRRSYACSAI